MRREEIERDKERVALVSENDILSFKVTSFVG
jgi:hypothetical protein